MGIRAGQPAVMPGAGYSPVSTGLSGSIVGAAGLVPALRLAEAAGLHDLIEEHLGVPSPNRAAKATSLVAGMLAGADSIDDPDLLRHGGMPRLFTQVRAPSTLGRRPGCSRRCGHRRRSAVAPARSRQSSRCSRSVPGEAAMRPSSCSTPQQAFDVTGIPLSRLGARRTGGGRRVAAVIRPSGRCPATSEGGPN